MPPVFKWTFLCPVRLIILYEMFWTTLVLFPIFYLIQDLMKMFRYIGEIRPIFTSIILSGCRTYKNLVVTSPFWLWGPLGLASVQLPVFSWIGFDLHLMKIYLSLYYHCRIAEILPQWQVCIVWRITNKTGHCYSISVFVFYLYALVYNKGSWFHQK